MNQISHLGSFLFCIFQIFVFLALTWPKPSPAINRNIPLSPQLCALEMQDKINKNFASISFFQSLLLRAITVLLILLNSNTELLHQKSSPQSHYPLCSHLKRCPNICKGPNGLQQTCTMYFECFCAFLASLFWYFCLL